MSENGEQTYNAKKYRTPDGVPADIVMFTLTKRERKTVTKTLPLRELKVMLIRRKKWPCAGMWALPGGFCQEDESIYDAATRELKEETGVDGGHLEYLGVYSTPGRDPRGWIISHAFFALVEEWMLEQRQASDDAGEVGLFTLQEVEELELAFDHHDIIKDAYLRIQQQMLQTTIARQFLPRNFTLSELYQVIQTVVPEFKEPNFIRKITSTRSRQGILKEVRDEAGNALSSNQYSQRPLSYICSQITNLCYPSIRNVLNLWEGAILMRALIVIDYTNDFVDGSLPVGQPAIDIEPRISQLTSEFVGNGDYVVMAVDLHEENDLNHPESKLFPPHNLRGSRGRELYGSLKTVYEDNQESIYWMDKTRYSAFCGTDLELKLRERGITELHLVGVCTDICVLHTAVDAYNKGFTITVHEDAVASFNPNGHIWALEHFRGSLGANIVKAQ